MTLEQIIQERDLKQKELAELIASQAIVAERKGELEIEIAKLDLTRKELSQGLIKSRARIKVLGLEVEQLKNQYFSQRAG